MTPLNESIHMTPSKKILVFLLCLGVYSWSMAQSAMEAPQTEAEPVTFPKNPIQKKDLFPFEPSANSKTLKFFIDTKNISADKDISKYVVVIVNPEGQDQTLYSAINCNSFMKYTYGSLQEDGTWKASVNPRWTPIGNLGYNNYAAYLGRRALCSSDSANTSQVDIMNRLKDSPPQGS
jgi:hypothetical protein